MSNLILTSATEKSIRAYCEKPTHALLLTGKEGSGLFTLANHIAPNLAGSLSKTIVIKPEKGLLSIDRIRMLYEITRSIQIDPQAIIIDDADSMSGDAQNALLKLLEEPVQKIHFILTSHAPHRLLPTILSRLQSLPVHAVDDQQSVELLKSYELSTKEIGQMIFLAQGLPAELHRLARDKSYFASQGALVTDARQFLQSDTYSRLKIIQKYTDRVLALKFLDISGRLLVYSALKQRNSASSKNMELFSEVMERLVANGHVKTQLLYLATKLA
jgi:hypothetical protein